MYTSTPPDVPDPPFAIFEFGRGFLIRKCVYSRVIQLDFNPCATADLVTASDGKLGGAWERGPKELGLMNVNFWITLANETFII